MDVAVDGAVRPLDEVIKEHILAFLELEGGDQTRTATQRCMRQAASAPA